jgi:hypothetical protein
MLTLSPEMAAENSVGNSNGSDWVAIDLTMQALDQAIQDKLSQDGADLGTVYIPVSESYLIDGECDECHDQIDHEDNCPWCLDCLGEKLDEVLGELE